MEGKHDKHPQASLIKIKRETEYKDSLQGIKKSINFIEKQNHQKMRDQAKKNRKRTQAINRANALSGKITAPALNHF